MKLGFLRYIKLIKEGVFEWLLFVTELLIKLIGLLINFNW